MNIFSRLGLVEAQNRIIMVVDNIPWNPLPILPDTEDLSRFFALTTFSEGLDFVHAHVGDCLIAIPDRKSHLQHLELAFQRHGIAANIWKC